MPKTSSTPKRFQVRRNGQWIKPNMKGFYWQCCDCKVIHRLVFRINGKGRVEFQAFREEGIQMIPVVIP